MQLSGAFSLPANLSVVHGQLALHLCDGLADSVYMASKVCDPLRKVWHPRQVTLRSLGSLINVAAVLRYWLY